MASDKKIYVITGSSGFLGQALARHFASDGSIIIGFDRDAPPASAEETECFHTDLGSDESVHQTFQNFKAKYGNKIAAVFHLAAYYSFSGEDSPLYKQITVDGTGRMLRELQNFEIGQFIFSSSMLVHKPNAPGEKLNEYSPIEPSWQYPTSKVETEKLIHEQRGSVSAVILRIAGVYNDQCHSIPIAHQIQRIYEGQLEGHLYSGDINVRQSFVHVDDIVKSFDRVVAHAAELPADSTFEIGEPDAMSYDEMQKEIGSLLDKDNWRTLSVPKPIAKVGAFVEGEIPFIEKPFVKPWMVDHADDNFELDISKAQNELGWTPEHTLKGTFPKMIDFLKSDPNGFYKLNHLTEPAWLKEKAATTSESRR